MPNMSKKGSYIGGSSLLRPHWMGRRGTALTKEEREEIKKESYEIARARGLLCGGAELAQKRKEERIVAKKARKLELKNLRKKRAAENAKEFAAEVAAHKALKKRK